MHVFSSPPWRNSRSGTGALAGIWCGFLLTLTLLGPAPISAQVPSSLSPADSAAVLLETARAFERQGDGEVARALYRHILQRYPGTLAAEEAREAVVVALPARVQEEGNGAVELQVWSTLYGLWLGVAVPGALGVEGPEPYGVGLLLGGPAGFLAGRLAAGSGELTLGQARAVTLGGTWGTWQGLGWQEVFELGQTTLFCPPEGPCYEEEDNTEERLAGMVMGGLIGLTTGALLARRGVSSATATGANFGALWGSWFGVAGGVLIGLEDDDLLAATLLTGNAGLVGGVVATPSLGWSRDRWRVVSIAGVLGGLGGLGVDLLVQPDDEKVAIGIPLAGSLVGLGVGIAASRAVDPASGPEEPLQEAFLSWRDGGLRAGAPIPYPVVHSVMGPRGVTFTRSLGLTLFQARF